MRTAWACSLLAQLLLVLALARAGKRDWWLRYLFIDLLRWLALWQFDTNTVVYFCAWTATEVLLSLPLQFLAVGQATEGSRSRWLGMGLGFWVFAISVMLTSPDWPMARRAALMARQAGMYGCAGALIGAAADGMAHGWLLAYYALQVLRVIAAQVAMARPSIEMVNVVSLAGSAALFLVWSCSILRKGRA